MKRLTNGVLLLGLVSLALFAVNAIPVAADSISIYPSAMTFTDALRGRDYFRTIGINNDNPTNKTYGFDASGDVAPWLSFVDLNDHSKVLETVEVPSKSLATVTLKLHIPAETPNGPYRGGARVLELIDPLKGKTTGSNVGLAALIFVDVTVTGTQKIDGTLTDLTVQDTEVGIPLTISATIRNDGNVEVTPKIHFSAVNEKGVTVDDAVFGDETVPPNDVRKITVRWDTVNALPGKYTGRITIDFSGLDLGDRTLPFSVFQRGTLTRSGKLENLRLLGTPTAGAAVKIGATITNTGSIESRAVFTGELHKGNVLLKAVNSPELSIAAGERRDIDFIVEIPSAGSYKLIGTMNFEGKVSEPQELNFDVGVVGGGNNPFIYGVAAAALAAVLVIVGVIWRMNRGGGRASGTAAGASEPGSLPPSASARVEPEAPRGDNIIGNQTVSSTRLPTKRGGD